MAGMKGQNHLQEVVEVSVGIGMLGSGAESVKSVVKEVT